MYGRSHNKSHGATKSKEINLSFPLPKQKLTVHELYDATRDAMASFGIDIDIAYKMVHTFQIAHFGRLSPTVFPGNSTWVLDQLSTAVQLEDMLCRSKTELFLVSYWEVILSIVAYFCYFADPASGNFNLCWILLPHTIRGLMYLMSVKKKFFCPLSPALGTVSGTRPFHFLYPLMEEHDAHTRRLWAHVSKDLSDLHQHRYHTTESQGGGGGPKGGGGGSGGASISASVTTGRPLPRAPDGKSTPARLHQNITHMTMVRTKPMDVSTALYKSLFVYKREPLLGRGRKFYAALYIFLTAVSLLTDAILSLRVMYSNSQDPDSSMASPTTADVFILTVLVVVPSQLLVLTLYAAVSLLLPRYRTKAGRHHGRDGTGHSNGTGGGNNNSTFASYFFNNSTSYFSNGNGTGGGKNASTSGGGGGGDVEIGVGGSSHYHRPMALEGFPLVWHLVTAPIAYTFMGHAVDMVLPRSMQAPPPPPLPRPARHQNQHQHHRAGSAPPPNVRSQGTLDLKHEFPSKYTKSGRGRFSGVASYEFRDGRDSSPSGR